MIIVTKHLTKDELTTIAKKNFGNLVKAVVDVKKSRIVIDMSLHADGEALLLEEGSQQEHLWGINLYPELSGDDFIEYDSMINVRPSQGNMSRGVTDKIIRDQIKKIVETYIS